MKHKRYASRSPVRSYSFSVSDLRPDLANLPHCHSERSRGTRFSLSSWSSWAPKRVSPFRLSPRVTSHFCCRSYYRKRAANATSIFQIPTTQSIYLVAASSSRLPGASKGHPIPSVTICGTPALHSVYSPAP